MVQVQASAKANVKKYRRKPVCVNTQKYPRVTGALAIPDP